MVRQAKFISTSTIDAGDNVNGFDHRGQTPLIRAIHKSYRDAVRILLDAGADHSLREVDDYPPFHIAAEIGNVGIGKMLLLAGVDIDAIRDRDGGGTALCSACERGNKDFVHFLIEAGCDIEKRAADGHQPLTASAGAGHNELVKILLSAGASINATCYGDFTALHAAASCGHHDVVLTLLENGALLTLPDMMGDTPIHQAARDGHHVVVKVLIDAGCDVNIRNKKLQTPLHAASENGRHDCVYTLLCARADVAARDCYGRSALHCAALFDHIEAIEVLLSAGGDPGVLTDKDQTPLVFACRKGSAKAANLLLDAGSDIHELTAHGRGALSFCSNAKVAKVMLVRGASATHIDMHGMSILHWAAFEGADTGVVCAFSKAGADILLLDYAGRTAADTARMYGHEKTAAMLDLLEEKHRISELTAAVASSNLGESGGASVAE